MYTKGKLPTQYLQVSYKYLQCITYSEVPNRRADRNKRAGLEESATLLAYLVSKLINRKSVIFCLLHEKLRAGWKKNLKNLSEHALLLGTSEYTDTCFVLIYYACMILDAFLENWRTFKLISGIFLLFSFTSFFVRLL
jgi:hypothetical protein